MRIREVAVAVLLLVMITSGGESYPTGVCAETIMLVTHIATLQYSIPDSPSLNEPEWCSFREMLWYKLSMLPRGL